MVLPAHRVVGRLACYGSWR